MFMDRDGVRHVLRLIEGYLGDFNPVVEKTRGKIVVVSLIVGRKFFDPT